MEVSDVKRLNELEEENRHQWVDRLAEQFKASMVLYCQAALLSRTAYYYQPGRMDTELVDALLALIDKHPRWGCPKCCG
jgi:putative transposase